MKHLVGDSGLCEFFDGRTGADWGKRCKKWKGIKYNRVKDVVYAKGINHDTRN